MFHEASFREYITDAQELLRFRQMEEQNSLRYDTARNHKHCNYASLALLILLLLYISVLNKVAYLCYL